MGRFWAVLFCLWSGPVLWGQATVLSIGDTPEILPPSLWRVCDASGGDPPVVPCTVGLEWEADPIPERAFHWCSIQLDLPSGEEAALAVFVSYGTGAVTVYWDGRLLYENRRWGSYSNYLPLSVAESQPGKHHLLLQVSDLSSEEATFPRVGVGTLEFFAGRVRYLNHRLIFMVAIFLTATLFFLTFYFGFSRKTSFLWLSAFGLTNVFKAILKPQQNFFSPDWLQDFQNYESIHLAVVLGAVALFGFILWEMSIPRRRWWLLGFAAFGLLAYSTISESHFLVWSMILSTLGILYGVRQKSEGAPWALVAMGGLMLFTYLGYRDWLGFGYFIGIIFFLLCMTISVGQKVAQQIRLRQEASLRSASLENQLLKKSIQPHFILNSLASLQELIDQKPAKASDFVERLAEEFRLVNKVSNKKLIPIADEIRLCQIHLQIMEYRKDAHFELRTEGLSGEEAVPPGIFHTLIENGITHGYGNRRRGQFHLGKVRENGHVRYIFYNDSEIAVEEGQSQSKGTGLRYLEARLREAYADGWELKSGAVAGGWQVELILKT